MATKKAEASTSKGRQVAQKPHPKLPNVLRITQIATSKLWQYKKTLVGITLMYGILNLILVQGLAAATDVVSLKEQLNQVFTGNLSQFASSISVFVVLVGSAGNGSSQTAGAYQLFLGLIASLAIIWALRQLFADNVIRVRDAYYRGMEPLVSFVLILLVIAIQLLPALIGSTIYSVIVSNGIAVHLWEQLLWLSVFFGLALVSLYMICSSVIALYIVTLPDMTPLKALRSARDLVRGRRWEIMRKLIFLPIALLVIAAVIMLPIIMILAPIAQWIFFVLTMFSLLAIHTYLYVVYRELLNE